MFGKNPLFIYVFSELFYTSLRIIRVDSSHDAFEWGERKNFSGYPSRTFWGIGNSNCLCYTLLVTGVVAE